MSDDEKTSILVVDDLPEKLLVYRTILEELGQNLVTASSVVQTAWARNRKLTSAARTPSKSTME